MRSGFNVGQATLAERIILKIVYEEMSLSGLSPNLI